MSIERTLAIIKPDALEAGHLSSIKARTAEAGFRVVHERTMRLATHQAAAFYEEHFARPFFVGLVASMTRTAIVVRVLEAEYAIARWRALIGATDPAKAGPETLRRLYGRSGEENGVHGSDSPASAAREIAFFFAGCELL